MVETARAIVCHGSIDRGGWKMEDVKLREIEEDELVVRIVASGICHTDILFGSGDAEQPLRIYPSIKGHEGSGYVEKVGSKVTIAAPGDPVLLSYNYCGKCQICKSNHPPYCTTFNEINFLGKRNFSLAPSTSSAELDICGGFFGQSSFSSVTIVDQKSVVNVKGLVNDQELKLLAPFGCGFQTGSGSIFKVAAATAKDTVAVLGMGGVGLAGIMAAKICNCKTIIGIDQVDSRLQIAKELGATHTIDTSKFSSIGEVVEVVRSITDGLGTTITMDATGYQPLIMEGIKFTAPFGKIIQVGTAKGNADFSIFEFMATGKQYIGAIAGDSIKSESIPMMIEWWREGKFPVERLVKFFKADDWEKAIHEMHDGATIKPVIVW